MASEPCLAPGPDGSTCAGRAGHTGLHGNGPDRWDDAVAEHEVQLAEADGQLRPPGMRGAVIDTAGNVWRGVVQLGDLGVQVELLAVRGARPPATRVQPCTAVWLPYGAVARIELAESG